MQAATDAQSLSSHLRFFSTKAAPRIMAPALVVLVAARLWVGNVGWLDLVAVAVVLALQPFTEWTIHVFILHFKPRRIGGRTVDLHAAKKHREHHLDPADPHKVFVPLPDLVALTVVATLLIFLLARSAETRLTAAVVSATLLVTYEWTHYLIHTAYRPKARYYRSIWRAHRLHHYKNENYWFGVTVNLADHVLGTFPEKSAVENSPTARTLGVETP